MGIDKTLWDHGKYHDFIDEAEPLQTFLHDIFPVYEGEIDFKSSEDNQLAHDFQEKLDGTNHLLFKLLDAKAKEEVPVAVAWEFEVKPFSGRYHRMDEQISKMLEEAVQKDIQQIDHRFRPVYSPEEDVSVTFHVDARMMCDMGSGKKYVLRRTQPIKIYKVIGVGLPLFRVDDNLEQVVDDDSAGPLSPKSPGSPKPPGA